ncbi:hypothetical protein XOCgx_3682 [Xanthomonas oryzae pv. oryzicola]|nr:hypothetical protein XOCgx_3682 [Xanthomonas oryzae pv. oryzicola]
MPQLRFFHGGVSAVAVRCTRLLQRSAQACTARQLPGLAALTHSA